MSEVMTGQSFADLTLPAAVLKQLEKMNFTTPTPIQIQAIPALMAGANVLGEAQTGTGKTAAFGLPGLSLVDAKLRATQMLVVAPTRELAMQVAEAVAEFGQQIRGLEVATVYGGSAFGPQIKALRGGAQVVVGTPGRLLDLLKKGVLNLSALRLAVLDEADEMLNMGFIEDIETIMAAVPNTSQRALFSATMPPAIRKLAKTFLVNEAGEQPLNIQIAAQEKAKATIRQRAWQVRGLSKMQALTRLLETLEYQRVLIFVRTRSDTMEVTEQLQASGFKASPLSGDLNQAQREQTVSQLRSGRIEILVATDVVARGLDVPEITHVVNYDLPGDTESYVHRIGRTGRAGRSGEAILFYRAKERHLLRHYERLTNGTIEYFEVPNAQELSLHRQTKLQEQIMHTVAQGKLDEMTAIVEKMQADTELTALQIATALLAQHNQQRPLLVAEDPAPRKFAERAERADRNPRERRDRNERSERPERGPRDRRDANIEFDTYRIQVGRDHGARPQDIVGAIANEGEIDSRYIGQIQLFEGHSLVELPKGLPTAVVRILQRARVRQQQMAIELAPGEIITRSKPPRGDRPRGERPPFKGAPRARGARTERGGERGSEQRRSRRPQ
ncbi:MULTISPECIES: DEAD/DEAH box helicase [Idiomarinaceae]|uniref:RNA helicase n=1 Tax=Pseudidiomarina fusca TaxID=2965078 RepID=A0ABU3KZH3_9GAMM|nr:MULTISPECIES: DEAD/DEAH box helicase [Idiomarinaceae]MDX1526563.1 DEAD/DEAH box helicase [Pseudidiomarina maritima]MDT7526291.1 DEAD/DEAH box helicase [Pseudidiomarina sp. GXY010]MRJ43036.1 DEAD/DEAH box helicase [Idiomarina sp. FeN1]NCU58218.1 DEAD/DEAH box helicase [Idiomarina sp. FenA--70]NCU60916.1 DEAD/DEAH box helicase [Idiomarina sp. FenBw--71]